MMNDQVALVLASSSGIGKAIAFELHEQGAAVMLLSRRQLECEKVQREFMERTGRKPEFIIGDVGCKEDIERAVLETAKKFGKITILVNNSGGPKSGSFASITDDDWQLAFQTTFLSYVRASRSALPYFESDGYGRIVNIVSSSVKAPLDNLVISNCFRLAIVGLTKTLAVEYGRKGILVNSVAPGKISTARTQELDRMRATKAGKSFEQLRAEVSAQIPIGRYGTVDEVAHLATFLCSPFNSYLTGQTLLIDGGLVNAY